MVWPMIYALQNSIHNWEDPEDFNPVSHTSGAPSRHKKGRFVAVTAELHS